MLYSISTLSIVLFALSVSGSPVPIKDDSIQSIDSTLKFQVNLLNLLNTTLSALDRHRAESFREHADDMRAKRNSSESSNQTSVNIKGKRASSFNVANSAVSYNAQVGVGSPPTEYTLLLDTGSSNTWVGASKKYASTSTSKNTGNLVSVSYGSGSMSGQECMWIYTFGNNVLTIYRRCRHGHNLVWPCYQQPVHRCRHQCSRFPGCRWNTRLGSSRPHTEHRCEHVSGPNSQRQLALSKEDIDRGSWRVLQSLHVLAVR